MNITTVGLKAHLLVTILSLVCTLQLGNIIADINVDLHTKVHQILTADIEPSSSVCNQHLVAFSVAIVTW